MAIVRYVLTAVLLLPVLEIAAFIGVASAIGFLRATLLIITTSLLGLLVVRGEGFAWAINAGYFPRRPIPTLESQAANLAVVTAGALLVLPGFITDAAGVVLLMVPRVISRAVLRRVFGIGRWEAREEDGTLDLNQDEWQRVPEKASGNGQHRASR